MKTTKHHTIINLITEIRNSHSQMKNIFLYGSCLNLFCILHTIYPEARAWFNIDHIITEIDGKYYDITGNLLQITVNKGNYMPFEQVHDKKGTSKSFRQMYKAEFKLKPF